MDDLPNDPEELRARLVAALADAAQLQEQVDKLSAIVWGKIHKTPLPAKTPDGKTIPIGGAPSINKTCQCCGHEADGVTTMWYGSKFCNECTSLYGDDYVRGVGKDIMDGKRPPLIGPPAAGYGSANVPPEGWNDPPSTLSSLFKKVRGLV